MADDVTINIRTRNARRSAREVDQVATSVSRLGRTAKTTGRGLSYMGSSVGRSAGRGLSFVGDKAKYAAAGLTGLAALGVRAGLQFNASMEQNEVAFTNFLGSAAAARRELAFLQRTAEQTPFELPQITQAARQLLAFGFPLKQANSLLGSLGDAAAGAGLGAEAIEQMVRSVGQIRGKGTLQAEELNQLGELGILNREDFAKNLGITTAELADAGNQGISGAKAISALQKTLDDTFGGSSAKQAKTFNGQLSTLKDNLNQTAGTLTRPIFNSLRKRFFPALNTSADALNGIFGRDDIDLAQKITLSRRVLRRKLGPFVNEAEAQIAKLELGEKAADGFERAVPALANAAADAAPEVAKAFWNGFMDAGPYGKALIALGVALQGGKAAAGLRNALGAGGPSGVRGRMGAGSATNPIAVVDIAGGGPGGGPVPGKGKGKGKGGKGGKLGRGAARVGGKAARFGGPVAAVGVTFGDMLVNPDDAGGGDGDVGTLARRYARNNRRQPRVASPPRRRDMTEVHLTNVLDGKVLERVVRRIEADRKARR